MGEEDERGQEDSRLEPALRQALISWRVRSAREVALSDRTPEQAALAGERVAVIVTYEGDVEALREAGLDTGFDRGGVVYGQIAYRDLERLATADGLVRVEMVPPFLPQLDETLDELRVPWKVPPTTPGKGAGVIVAVIDTGIDIFHESFRLPGDPTKTRILELWDQAASTGGTSPPAGFQNVGQIFSKAQIEAGLAAGPPFHSVDTNGHGTHVAGTAAGNGSQDDRCSFPGRYVGVAPLADLVVVKAISLPSTVTPAIPDALQWCAQAGSRHGNRPVVINCSFGSQFGPHDGTSATDREIDQLLRPAAGPPAGLAIICAAGNEGRSQIHESGTIQANQSVTLSFYIGRGSQQADILDLWYNGTATLNATLTAPPNPAQPGPLTTGQIPTGVGQSQIGQMTIATFSSPVPSATNNNKKQINFNISVPAGQNLNIRNGVWRLTLTEAAGVAANWDAWVMSSGKDRAPTFRLPDENGDPPARRLNNTIASPGSSLNAITVANYHDDDGEITRSSSRGVDPIPPATPVGEVKPTVAAPGTAVAAARSRDDPKSNSSCCDQKVLDKTGTSMASPHVAGVVALMFEKNRTLNFEQVRAHLQHSTRIDGIPAGEVPQVHDALLDIRAHHIWGSGKVQANAALAEMPAIPAAPPVGGGGRGGGRADVALDETAWGYTPHTIYSRLGDWRNRCGARPGLMLIAGLISEHVDEVLRLVNQNSKVGTVWKRHGGPDLVRHLLHGHQAGLTLFPEAVPGCELPRLLERFLPILERFGGDRLRADIERHRGFIDSLPGSDLDVLDRRALELAASA